MGFSFKQLRRQWHQSPYPFYATDYLEEFFYRFYIANKTDFDAINFTLIPIWWTTAYLDHLNIQPYIDVLPKEYRYFAVSQHDDAIKEKLPEGTIVFSAGGNTGGIPLPLVCSDMPKSIIPNPTYQDILCSFVGSPTHLVRQRMIHLLGNDKDFVFEVSPWSFNIGPERTNLFIDVTSRSSFTLCPRGYGAQSFRTYEAIQLGSVPVYIHDHVKWLPFEDDVDWESFAVVISDKDISKIPKIIRSINHEDHAMMKYNGMKAYQGFFCLESICKQIYKQLKEYNEDN
jgi:hypothetical protein